MNHAPRRGLVALALSGLLLAPGTALTACSTDTGGASQQAVFRMQPGTQPGAPEQACQLHQTHQPTAAYRGGPGAVSALELPFLAYYTANGNKDFCDAKPPTDLDKDWARLYVDLTGNTTAVQRILTG